MAIVVNQEFCKGCGICIEACPAGAIRLSNGKALIDAWKCSSCEKCLEVCPTDALQISYTDHTVRAAQPRAIEVKQPDLIIETPPNPSARSVVSGVLSQVFQYALPRLVDIVATFLEQRLTNPVQQRELTPRNTNEYRARGRRQRRRGRMNMDRN